MGAIANFKLLLDKADTPYFMWLGGHDLLPDGYVRQLTQLLENCPEAVLAYGASHHVDMNGKPAGDYDYYYYATLADKSPATRIMGLIRYLDDCSLVHGVFRTETLRVAWIASGVDAFIGADHVLLTHAAIKGPFLYAPETYLIRLNAHSADSPLKRLKRMDLRQPDREQLSRRGMQRQQYVLAATVSKGTGLSGFLYRLIARTSLVKRFGRFGDTFLTRNLDVFIILLTRRLSDIPFFVFRNFARIFRSPGE